MVGARGIAKERLAPSGYIQVRGELWKAELMEGSPPLEKGERVRVGGARGLTLIVKHIDEEREIWLYVSSSRLPVEVQRSFGFGSSHAKGFRQRIKHLHDL